MPDEWPETPLAKVNSVAPSSPAAEAVSVCLIHTHILLTMRRDCMPVIWCIHLDVSQLEQPMDYKLLVLWFRSQKA